MKKTLTWDPRVSTMPDSNEAHTSFRATVSTDAPDGTVLTAAAAGSGETCAASDPCAATLDRDELEPRSATAMMSTA